MLDLARDPAARSCLQVQRSRPADRMRPPRWYLTGVAIMYALVFAFPFASRSWAFASGPSLLPHWWWPSRCSRAWTRATGIKMGFRNLSYPGPGRPARYRGGRG